MKWKTAFWQVVSVLYALGCVWLYFSTLNFSELDFLMSPEDFVYMQDCLLFALHGVIMALVPVLCLWLEFCASKRFGRISFWCRRYGVWVTVAVIAAVLLWFRSHAAPERPYSDEKMSLYFISAGCWLVLLNCINRAGRRRLI